MKLIYGINTHVHADHITGTHNLRSNHPEMKTGLGSANEAKSDVKFDHGQVIKVGETINLEVRATPGHTEGCVTYVGNGLIVCFKSSKIIPAFVVEIPGNFHYQTI